MNRSILCTALAAALLQAPALAAAAAPAATEGHETQIVDFDAMVVTAVAPSATLTFVTDPRLPRQPVPASDGADYLKTIPGFGVMRSGGTNGDPVLRGM
ncbi:MAG: TonB-dependent copper receptor, partial [Luteimonas sp.]